MQFHFPIPELNRSASTIPSWAPFIETRSAKNNHKRVAMETSCCIMESAHCLFGWKQNCDCDPFDQERNSVVRRWICKYEKESNL